MGRSSAGEVSKWAVEWPQNTWPSGWLNLFLIRFWDTWEDVIFRPDFLLSGCDMPSSSICIEVEQNIGAQKIVGGISYPRPNKNNFLFPWFHRLFILEPKIFLYSDILKPHPFFFGNRKNSEGNPWSFKKNKGGWKKIGIFRLSCHFYNNYYTFF